MPGSSTTVAFVGDLCGCLFDGASQDGAPTLIQEDEKHGDGGTLSLKLLSLMLVRTFRLMRGLEAISVDALSLVLPSMVLLLSFRRLSCLHIAMHSAPNVAREWCPSVLCETALHGRCTAAVIIAPNVAREWCPSAWLSSCRISHPLTGALFRMQKSALYSAGWRLM